MSGPSRTIDPIVISEREAARLVGMGLTAFRAIRARGEVPHVRLGARVMIPVQELREWVAAQVVGGDR